MSGITDDEFELEVGPRDAVLTAPSSNCRLDDRKRSQANVLTRDLRSARNVELRALFYDRFAPEAVVQRAALCCSRFPECLAQHAWPDRSSTQE